MQPVDTHDANQPTPPGDALYLMHKLAPLRPDTEGIGVGLGRTDNRIKLIPQAQAIGFR
jgi:hypothetical protein